MTFRDRLLRYKNIALVSYATSIYNEDSMTATELTQLTAKKTRECMKVVEDLANMVEELALALEYSEEEQELKLSIEQRLEKIQEDSYNCYTSIYNEDAMTVLELAGCTAKHVNECIRIINETVDVVSEIYSKLGLKYDANNEEITINGGAEQ